PLGKAKGFVGCGRAVPGVRRRSFLTLFQRKAMCPIVPTASRAILFVALVGVLCQSGCSGGRKMTEADYKKITKGMSQCDVETALGKGEKVVVFAEIPAPTLAENTSLIPS